MMNTMEKWAEWYNNWYHKKFGFLPMDIQQIEDRGVRAQSIPEEVHPMTTEQAIADPEEATEKAVSPVQALETLRTTLAEKEKALGEAGTAHDTEAILKLAVEVSSLRDNVLKTQKDANKGAITEIEDSLKAGIQVLVSNVKYQELTGEPIKNVLWFFVPDEAGNLTAEVGIRINAGRKAPSSGGGGSSGNGRKVIANQTVTRTLADGKVESLTVKEVVQTYASDEVKNSSLYEPKKAWSILYPKVNRDLEPKFSEPV